MAVLVTGGAGFVGSRLADRLLKMGQEVVILDNFNDYYDTALKRANIAALDSSVQVVEGDVRDEALIARIFNDYDITRVAHLAAMAGVRYSSEQGRLYADVNTSGSVTLMDAARKRPVEVFVQASTSSVYGNTDRVPFAEDDAPDFPLAPYPASKRAAELFGYSYHHLFGLNVTVLRFFNVYGPHGRPDMMPMKVIDAILNDQPIQVFDGGDLKRDWTYIDDTVDGVIAALERPMGYQIINLGYGSPVSLTEFIEVYEELIGKNAIQNYVPAPLTEPRITYCDNSRARQLLGFNPKIALPEGLARTWEWYKKHHQIG
jgi:UDP-glucuronate 4-epimerase